MTTMKHTAKEKVRARRRARGTPFARLCALGLALCMALSLLPVRALAAEDTEAAAIRLRETQGAVRVRNASAAEQSIRSDMRIYNGWRVQTDARSYAWLSLDDSKAVKLDQVSEAEVRKNGKMLDLLLNAGNLYFSVDKPLEDDESLNIRTSTIVMGVRGTAGWVRHVNSRHTQVYILEGTVQCTVTDPDSGVTKTARIDAGEMADLHVNGAEAGDEKDEAEIEKSVFQTGDIDGFVLTELAGDDRLIEKIYEATETDIDLRALTPEEAQTRQSEKEDAVSQRLSVLSAAEARQERGVSKDPVWEAAGGGAGQAVPIRPHSDSPSYRTTASTGGSDNAAPASNIVTTADASQINRLLQSGYDVIFTGQGTADALQVPEGRTLTNAGQADLTLAGSGVNRGTIVNNHTLTVSGSLENLSENTVLNNGVLTVSGSFINGGSLAGRFVNSGSVRFTGEGRFYNKFNGQLSGQPIPESGLYYAVRFVTNGGGTLAELDVRSGAPLPGIAVPPAAPDGKRFRSWYTDAGLAALWQSGAGVGGNLVLYAGWDSIEPEPEPGYTVTYTDGADGETLFADQVTSGLPGGSITPSFLGAPARQGYHFAGWTPAVSATVTGDAVYTAVWAPGAEVITYREAVDVTSAIGVVGGSESGFGPAAGLSRAEGAKIAAYMLLGRNAAEQIVGGAKYTDVPANHWAAGYIEYLAVEKYIEGLDGGNTFAPDGVLTVAQFARMMLGALGYDAEIEGLKGADWITNTGTLARQAGLFEGCPDIALSAQITREQAALLAFNTLCSPLVTYESASSAAVYVISYGLSVASYNHINDTFVNGMYGNRGQIIEFGEEYYSKLVRDKNASDAFMRPATVWTYDGKMIGAYLKDFDLLYTTDVTLGQIYRDLSLTQTTYVTNNGTAGGESRYFIDGLDAGGQSAALAADSTVKIGGNGVRTYVYCQNGSVSICEVHWYIGDVVGVYAATARKDAYIDIAGRGKEAEPGTITQDSGSVTDKFTSGSKEITGFSLDEVVIYTCSWKSKGSTRESPAIVIVRSAESGVPGSSDSMDKTAYNATYKAVQPSGTATVITFREAVDVMTAVGVLDSSGDSLTAGLSRAEGAKIAAYMLLGSSAADQLTGGARFADVPASHWAAGYIEYLAAKGIVNGIDGGGSFDPDGALTNVYFARMMLGALGYDAEIEGLNGEDWMVKTLVKSKTVGVFDGWYNMVSTAQITREQAALLACNTLCKPMVEYENGTAIYLVNTGAGGGQYQQISNVHYNSGNGAVYQIVEFGEEYFSKLARSTSADAFMRPATTWTYDGRQIGAYLHNFDLLYTADVTLGQIYRDLGLTKTTYVTSDGTAGGASLYFIDGLDAGGQAVALTDGSNQKIGGKGVETCVYYSDGTVRICEINWYVGDVTGVYAENETNPAYIDIAGRGVEIENGTIAQDSGAVTCKNTSGTKEISGFSVDDVIIYTCSWKDKANGVQDSPDIVEIRKAEIITGELSAFVTIGRDATVNGRSASGSVFIGQNKYDYSAKVANTPDITALMSFPGAELDVVLDKYGYAIDVGKILNYAVVVKTGVRSDADGDHAMVNLLLTNGKTTGAVELSTADGAHAIRSGTYTVLYSDGVSRVSEGDVVSCAGVTADGKYTLEYKRARISNNPPSYGFDTTGLIGEKLITNGASQLLLSAFGPDAVGHAGDKTIFLLKGPNGNYKSYKGVREVPTVEIIGADILTINSRAEKSATAQLVYVDAGTDSVKIHSSDFDGEEVFVDQGYAVVVNAGIGGTFGDALMVNLLLTDGTVTGAVELSTKNSAHFAPVGSNTIYYGDGVTPVSEGDIVTYAKSSGGMYILTFKSAKASNNPPYTGFDTTGLIGQKLIATGESQLLLSAFGAGSAGRADSKTVFLIRDASGEYNPYKGVSKAPTVEITGAGVLTINSYAENSTAAQLVYVDVGENGAASIQPAGDSFDVGEDVFVKFPAAAAKTVSTNGYYYELPAWVNGVARTIHLNGSQGDAAYADGSAAEYRLYSSMTTDSDDITTLGDESRPVFGSTEYNNGDIGLGGTWYSLADSCSVFLLTGGDLSESTIEAIPTSGATKLWFNTDSGGNASCIIWTTDVSPTFTADDRTASGLSWEDFIAAKLADVPIGNSLNIVSDAVTLTNDLTIPTGKRVVISGDVYVNSTGDGETLLTVNGALQAGSLTIGASDAAGAATTVTMNVVGSTVYPASVVTTNNIVVKTDGHVNVSTDGTLYAWNQSGAGNVISGSSLDILGLTSDVTFSGKTVLKGLLTILAGNLSFGSGLEIDDSAAAGTARLTIGQTGGADRITVDVRGGVSARTDNTDSANLIEVLSTGDGDGSVSLGDVSLGSGAGLAIAGGGTADPVVSLGTVSGEGSLQNESANTTAETVALPDGSVTGIRIPGSGGRLNIRIPVYAEGKAVETDSADVTGTVYRIDGDTAILKLTFQSTEAPAADAGGYAAENFLVLAVTRAEDGKVYLTIRRNQS